MVKYSKYLVALSLFGLLTLITPKPLFIPEAMGADTPKKRALLVGINYEGLSKPLNGCINDVMKMKEVLISHYGFDEGEIKLLIEQSATRKNILDAFQSWLIDGTKPGDA